MRSRMVCLFLILCLAPLGSTPLVTELKAISMQQEIAWNEAEKALDDLGIALELSETAHKKSKEELRGLKAEHQNLKLEIVRLRKASAGSEMQKAEVERQFNLAVQRIDNLKDSFKDYQKRVARLERQKKTWRTLSLIEFLIILAGGAFAILR